MSTSFTTPRQRSLVSGTVGRTIDAVLDGDVDLTALTFEAKVWQHAPASTDPATTLAVDLLDAVERTVRIHCGATPEQPWLPTAPSAVWDLVVQGSGAGIEATWPEGAPSLLIVWPPPPSGGVPVDGTPDVVLDGGDI